MFDRSYSCSRQFTDLPSECAETNLAITSTTYFSAFKVITVLILQLPLYFCGISYIIEHDSIKLLLIGLSLNICTICETFRFGLYDSRYTLMSGDHIGSEKLCISIL